MNAADELKLRKWLDGHPRPFRSDAETELARFVGMAVPTPEAVFDWHAEFNETLDLLPLLLERVRELERR